MAVLGDSGPRPPHTATVVMKFGGTSVADAACIKRVARRIVQNRREGHPVVAVVSARGDTTDELIELAKEISDEPAGAGDGHAAVHRRADLRRPGGHGHPRPGVRRHLADRVPGRHRHRHRAHQGQDPRHQAGPRAAGARRGQDRARGRLPGHVHRTTTSPRWAAAAPTPPPWPWPRPSDAEVCEIYTDVDGVYTTDPRIVPEARKLAPGLLRRDAGDGRHRGQGAAWSAASSSARRYDVPIHVRSSFTDAPGTWIGAGGGDAWNRPSSRA